MSVTATEPRTDSWPASRNVTTPGPDQRSTSATRNEALAHFERVARVATGLTDDAAWNEQKARNRRIYRARQTAETCALCGEPNEGDVWRRSVYLGPGIMSHARYGVAPVCEGCNGRDSDSGIYWLRSYHRPARCEGGCGRQVHQERRTYYWCCSERCRQRSRNARRRRHRARRREGLTCANCGETFEASRSDAEYCKPACRQKAYRERKAREEA